MDVYGAADVEVLQPDVICLAALQESPSVLRVILWSTRIIHVLYMHSHLHVAWGSIGEETRGPWALTLSLIATASCMVLLLVMCSTLL